MRPRLILIHGLPGTGKSTLAAKLQRDLELPLLGKDQVKEWLFDTMNEPAASVTKLLGKTASEMLYVFAENFLADGRSVIIENAFHAKYARPALAEIISRTGASCVELYCQTEAMENKRRFMSRITDGTRHAVHTDTDWEVDTERLQLYEPLAIGSLKTVDTTRFGDDDYHQLLSEIQEELAHD